MKNIKKMENKNIYLLPTDKESRVRYNLSNTLVFTRELYRDYGNGVNQHIYITSDEKIKQGDWFTSVPRGTIHKCTGIFENNLIDNTWENREKVEITKADCKKIILTTDLDLIKDGIQPIEDSFLEWLVNNSSCEFVEVKNVKTPDGIFYHKDNVPYSNYQIIIPKEEPKQETRIFGTKDDTQFWSDKPLQPGYPDYRETLENLKYQLKKVMKEHPIDVNKDTYWRGVKIGLETAIEVIKLKEQNSDKKYSEKDMKQFAWLCVANFLSNKENSIERDLVTVIINRNNLEFEEFKNK